MKTIKTNIEPDNYLAPHFISRSNWLRAAVIGANDGILSTEVLRLVWQQQVKFVRQLYSQHLQD